MTTEHHQKTRVKKNLQKVQAASVLCFTTTVLGPGAGPHLLPPELTASWRTSQGGCRVRGGAQSSSEKAKSSTTSSSPWASCSRSERDSTWELLLCARCEPRGAALPSSGGGRRERCKSCCSEAGGGSSLLINPRHSLIYQCCCSSQIAVGECCRVMYSAGSEYWGRQESKVTAVPVPTSGLRL